MEIAKDESIPSVCKNQAMSFCSVCLDAVVEGEDRSIALLKCGHRFHLDCIGSAFNAKGRMQCPNCRQVEQGRWLYANACCIHEDFIEDLTSEEDAELYNAAAGLVSHAPWCPYQSTFGHISLALEELGDSANGYFNPLQTAVHRMQVPGVMGGQVCPYLVGMHNISLGRPLNHIEDIIAWQMNYVGGALNGVGTRHARHGLQSGSMLLASNGSYENHLNGPFGQLSFRHLSLGFLMGSPQLAQAGYANSASLFRSGNTHTRWTRHSEHAFETTQQTRRASPSERSQMSEPIHGNGSYPSGQSPNRANYGDGMSWTVERSQMGAFHSYGVPAHWWVWVPNETRSGAMQNRVPTMYPYHGQFSSSTSARPIPAMEGSVERSPEGPYTWLLH